MRTLAQTSALRSRRDFLRMTSAAGLAASLGVQAQDAERKRSADLSPSSVAASQA